VLAVDENSTMTRKDKRNKTSGLPLWMHGWNSVMSILIKHGGQPQPLDKGGLSSPHSELRPVWSEQGRDWLPSHKQDVRPRLIGRSASWVNYLCSALAGSAVSAGKSTEERERKS